MNVGKRLVDILDKYLRFSKQDRDAVHQLISGLEDKPKALGVSVRNTITEIRSGNVIIDYANGVTLVNPDTGKRSIFLDSNGNAYFGSNTELPSTTSLVIFSNWKTYSGELLSAGDVLLGDNTPNKANLLWDRSTGKLLFRSGTTTHAYVDIDGAIKAGAGHVLLDVNGITIKADTVYHDTRAVKFVDPSSNVFSHLSGRYGISTTWVYTYLINEGNATYPDSFVYISSQPNTANDDAEMLLSAGLYGPCNITLKNLYGSPKEIKLDAEKAIIDVADYGLTVQADNSSVYFSAPTFQVSGYDGQVNFQLDRPAGSYGFLELQTASSPRWRFAINSTAETGSNAGSDFEIQRFNDAGAYIDTPFAINRSYGIVEINTAEASTYLNIKNTNATVRARVDFADGSGKIGALDHYGGNLIVDNRKSGGAICFDVHDTTAAMKRIGKFTASSLIRQLIVGDGTLGTQLLISSASGYKSQLLFLTGGNLAAVWETDTNNDLVWQRYNPPGTFADTGLTLDSSSGDIYTVPWTEYTISTVYGWSSYTVKKIYYKKIGKWLYVYFYISGQAHASDTSASFTFPYNPTSTQSFVQPIRVVDGGTYKFGLLRVTGGSGTCNLYTSAAEGAWATSGLKDAQGWFLIQSP